MDVLGDEAGLWALQADSAKTAEVAQAASPTEIYARFRFTIRHVTSAAIAVVPLAHDSGNSAAGDVYGAVRRGRCPWAVGLSMDGSERFAVARHSEGDAVVLSVTGAVDEVTAPSLATHLDVVLTAQPPLLVVDLTAVEFMSSAGMNLLVETQRLTEPTPTTLRVAAAGTATSRPMRIIGLDRILELFASVSDAVQGHHS